MSSADPKAIVHTHGATIRKVQAELGMCLPGSLPGRTFCAMPFFWVGGPQDLLGALHSGAAVVSQERFEIGECLDLLEREQPERARRAEFGVVAAKLRAPAIGERARR